MGMSEFPELELIHGDLCEISERLEKINKNLEELLYPVLTEIAVKFEDTNKNLKDLIETIAKIYGGIPKQ